MATADMSTKKIYHEDSISGTHSKEGRDGATILKHLLENIAKHNCGVYQLMFMLLLVNGKSLDLLADGSMEASIQ